MLMLVMTEDKPEEGSHLRSLARSHREARSGHNYYKLLQSYRRHAKLA